TDNDMAQGIIKLGVKFEPPAPMVDIRITAYRNIASYTLLLNQVAQEITSGSAG
ncbi:MAG TPA: phage tail protein, partial [Ochrobactrum anthropi]|nr:phage tail protein [Brucella anthropi]